MIISDIRILSIIISGSVAIIIAVLNHFVITPVKERRVRKIEQLRELYAPLYGVINIRTKLVIEVSMRDKKLMLGNLDKIEYQSTKYMETFILNNSGYGSNELLDAWIEYSSQFGQFKKEITEQLVMTVVKDYNQFKKDLNISYNKDEISSGIPESIKEYRKFVA